MTSDRTSPTGSGLPAPETYRKLLDSSLDVICSIDRWGRFVQLSAACRSVWHYSPEELAGRPYLDLVLPEDRAPTEAAAAAVMSGVNLTGFENRYRCGDGTVKPILWSARWDEEEGVLYCVAKDASTLRSSEQQARGYKERLYRAYKLSGIGWWEWNPATGEQEASEELYHIYGLDRAQAPELSLELFQTLVHPDDRELLADGLSHIYTEPTFSYEHRIIRPDGAIRHLQHQVNVERNSVGGITLVNGTTRDISVEKTNALALRRSQAQLEQILGSIRDGFLVIDRDWNIVYWNAASEELLRRRRPDVIGRNIWEVFPEARNSTFHKHYRLARIRRRTVHFEASYGPLGIWLDVRAFPSPEGLSVFFRDITEQRAANEALRISEESYRQLFENIPLPTWVYELETFRFLDVNEAAVRHYGFTKQEFLRMTLLDVRPPSEHERFLQAVRKRLQAPARQEIAPFVHQRKDGTPILVEVSISPMIYKGRSAMLSTIKDVTARTRLQEELLLEKIRYQQDINRATIEAQERERSEIGKELHDNVNQVLTTIKLYIENIRNYPDHQLAFLDKSVELTQRAINEIRYLARQLVTPVINDLDFRATLEELAQHFESLRLFRIRIDLQFCEEALDKELRLTLYRIAQEQLNNIVKYARATEVQLTLRQEPGVLELRVCDNGVGFDPALVKGGLGLKNIRNRVEVYKGTIRLQSAPGEGCCLTASLPV